MAGAVDPEITISFDDADYYGAGGYAWSCRLPGDTTLTGWEPTWRKAHRAIPRAVRRHSRLKRRVKRWA